MEQVLSDSNGVYESIEEALKLRDETIKQKL